MLSDGLDGLRDGGHAIPELREMFAQDLRALRNMSQESFNNIKALIESPESGLSPDELRVAMKVHAEVAAEGSHLAAFEALDWRTATPEAHKPRPSSSRPRLETTYARNSSMLSTARKVSASGLPTFSQVLKLKGERSMKCAALPLAPAKVRART